ncbi:hypothetical protein DERF_001244 [Dermatophagoides farinae]|uniref:Uncharacterized protein n=1 Tax=Dermatophagoides farinae TaxID=6954 RepID=A0A922L9G2_DERFA|nr:uncharacterized protein LOC124491772 [Dermatophagoides farinae]KAH9527213.1 hypothetical protein DERF_001244 [Dermatophagoides farinae]
MTEEISNGQHHNVYQNDDDDDDNVDNEDDEMTTNECKKDSFNDDDGTKKRSEWFMNAYISVATTIIGIIIIVAGAIVTMLKRIRFVSGWNKSGVYLGKGIAKWSGEITIIVGLIIAIIGYICYRQCLKRIDLYIKNLQDENDDQRVMRKHNDHDYDEIPASRSSEEKKQFLD